MGGRLSVAALVLGDRSSYGRASAWGRGDLKVAADGAEPVADTDQADPVGVGPRAHPPSVVGDLKPDTPARPTLENDSHARIRSCVFDRVLHGLTHREVDGRLDGRRTTPDPVVDHRDRDRGAD